MKLTSDKSILGRDRRIVSFMLEDDDEPINTAYTLSKVFLQPCAVVRTPFGEHRLPAEICKTREAMAEALSDVKITGIEIGEGKGRSDVIFTVDCTDGELICIGPLEYDFYSLMNETGIKFSL